MKKKWIMAGIALAFAVLLSACEGGQGSPGTDTTSPAPTEPTASETVTPAPSLEPSESSGAEPSPTTPPVEPAALDSIYSKLSDEQFSQLTGLVAESFYSFTVDDAVFNSLDEETMNCLTSIYDYAYAHYFELDPDYKAAFEARSNVVMEAPNFDRLKENFIVEMYLDMNTGQWVTTIASYSLNPDDVVSNDGLYVDAEGYLSAGVKVYWEGDSGKMEEAGEIKEIAYNREIDGTEYTYALNVEYFDDPYSSGWRDGESFLTTSKRLNGKPMYYVDVLDPNRSIKKEIIDYSGSIQWQPLTQENVKAGMEVYLGALSAKTYMFTVVQVDPANDSLTVEYPSGSVEAKSLTKLDYEHLYTK